MAVQTPIAGSQYDAVLGSIRAQIVKFASVANADTFVTDMGQIIAVLEGGAQPQRPMQGCHGQVPQSPSQ